MWAAILKMFLAMAAQKAATKVTGSQELGSMAGQAVGDYSGWGGAKGTQATPTATTQPKTSAYGANFGNGSAIRNDEYYRKLLRNYYA